MAIAKRQDGAADKLAKGFAFIVLGVVGVFGIVAVVTGIDVILGWLLSSDALRIGPGGFFVAVICVGVMGLCIHVLND